jgi:hypothetical protein
MPRLGISTDNFGLNPLFRKNLLLHLRDTSEKELESAFLFFYELRVEYILRTVSADAFPVRDFKGCFALRYGYRPKPTAFQFSIGHSELKRSIGIREDGHL